MKKVLLGTSALAVAMSAGAALADGHAAPTLKFDGSYEVGFIGQSIENGNASNNQEDAQFFEDAELRWSISYPVESLGVSVGHKAELQVGTNNPSVDKSYIFIEGGFGRIDIGENGGSTNDFAVKAYLHGPAVGADSSAAIGAFATPAGLSADNAKIKYTTPVLGGLVQGGVSFTPVQSTVGGDTTSTGTPVEDVIEAGAKLTADLGGAALTVGAGFGTGDAKDTAAVPATGNYHVGATVGIAGFTVGGSYGKTTGDNNADEPSVWQVGAGYSTGPWSFGVDYGVEDTDVAGADDNKTYSIGGSYKLAETVILGAGYNAVESNAVNSDASKTGVSLTVAF